MAEILTPKRLEAFRALEARRSPRWSGLIDLMKKRGFLKRDIEWLDAVAHWAVSALIAENVLRAEQVRRLQDYTQHKPKCSRWHSKYVNVDEPPCDCGLYDLLRGTEPGE